jgi:hypothetical protein
VEPDQHALPGRCPVEIAGRRDRRGLHRTQWMNQGAFLMRGLKKVRAEFSLTALAYNLRRVLNIVELPKLIAALPA